MDNLLTKRLHIMTNLTCFDVANYILSLNDNDAGDLISNLKLQKLVYYTQGFSLAILGKPLFNEKIEAWMHGPVIPDLYHKYKSFGSGAIDTDNLDIDFSKFSEDEKNLIQDVFNMYGQYSAWKLRNLTHEEPTWIGAYGRSNSTEISLDSMRKYFLTQIEN
ncbi:Panacea domain-containing protein [Gilliamella sp. Occ4-3]|uniref:Panacea domain-containing protein n=1 Tax=Gilliamella sp. Occ4-3 TaxID=3120254 RepID=UPI001C541CEB|nr:type II toxin-antitoxin system antitoxin SocA domain-containing protein [Gilliamella apicola]